MKFKIVLDSFSHICYKSLIRKKEYIVDKDDGMQRAFDKAVNGLWEQKAFSKNSSNCLYRGPNGTKCAIGFLIPDSEYKSYFDVRGILANSSIIYSAIDPKYQVNCSFLADMQDYLHDDLSTLGEWSDEVFIEAVEFFAESYGLKNPIEK